MNKAKGENLRDFFAHPENQTTRERIFFSRLSFDLKIAAARAGYHLHLYEPDVDRDGFDIIVEDEDITRWYQTKAVLSSVGTLAWEILADLLRPARYTTEAYGIAPVDAGRGGGVILIEINDETSDGNVVYSYTDFDIIAAIAEGFLAERTRKGAGRPPRAARAEAVDVIKAVLDGERRARVSIPKKLFVRLESADHLLGTMGLRSEAGVWHSEAVQKAYGRVSIGKDGSATPDAPVDKTAILHYHMKRLCGAQEMGVAARKVTLFEPFKWIDPDEE